MQDKSRKLFIVRNSAQGSQLAGASKDKEEGGDVGDAEFVR